MDLSGLSVSLSKAQKEINLFEGDKDEDSETNYSISAGKAFTAKSAPPAPSALSTLLKAGAGAAVGALGGAYVSAPGGGKAAAYGAGAGATAGAWAAAAMVPDAPDLLAAKVTLDYKTEASIELKSATPVTSGKLAFSPAGGSLEHGAKLSLESLNIEANAKAALTLSGKASAKLSSAKTDVEATAALNLKGTTTSLKGTTALNIETVNLTVKAQAATLIKTSGVAQIQGSILQLG